MKDLKLQPGDRVECVEMPDDPDPIPPGTRGTVVGAFRSDGVAIIQVDWDNGRSLNLSIPPDRFRRVEGES
ncbi:MAG: DUF4314 domain-containing protein [Acidimicrobiia bacterium]